MFVAFWFSPITSLHANQALFSLEVGEGHFSDGMTPISSADFTFTMGAFQTGFEPTAQNMSDWEANFITGPENDVETGLLNAVSGWWHYGSAGYPEFGRTGFQAIVRPNGGIGEGDQIYIWGYNSKDLSGVAEWILLTNSSWTFPEPTPWGELFLPPDTGLRSTDPGTAAIVGSINHPDFPEDAFARMIQTASVGAGGGMPESSGTLDGGEIESDGTEGSTDGGVAGMGEGFSDAGIPAAGGTGHEVESALLAFMHWIHGSGVSVWQTGFGHRPAGDVFTNIQKYFLGFDPTADYPVSLAGEFSLDWEYQGGTYPGIRFLRPKDLADVDYILQRSTDLVNWEDGVQTTELPLEDFTQVYNNGDDITFQDSSGQQRDAQFVINNSGLTDEFENIKNLIQ